MHLIMRMAKVTANSNAELPMESRHLIVVCQLICHDLITAVYPLDDTQKYTLDSITWQRIHAASHMPLLIVIDPLIPGTTVGMEEIMLLKCDLTIESGSLLYQVIQISSNAYFLLFVAETTIFSHLELFCIVDFYSIHSNLTDNPIIWRSLPRINGTWTLH